MYRYRILSIAGLLVLVSALVGGFWGPGAQAIDDGLQEQSLAFTTALAAVENGYVEKIPSERLVYGAISGMLQTLDPHSTFLDPRYYAQLRERQEGHYYGLGISILVVDGDIQVQNLFEGSPAYRKGIRRGDVIAKIEGEDTKGWTSEQAVRRLKGPRGTYVHIAIRRQGHDDLIELDVMRDDIKIPSVPAFFMIGSDIGYVKVAEFAENTDDELGAALEKLTAKGMKRVVLDLRSNPGGPLDQAIRVANRFLRQGELIVYTRGRVSNSDADYRAMEKSAYTTVPVVVLVNRSSASASEIVSGALQDHDRGLIVGETTFGKALVQSVYGISQGAGLALTTARYYTPSGRLIQRPWDATFDEYISYTSKDQASSRERPPSELFYTDAKRKVFGGGGIEPDQRFDGPMEGFNPTRFGRSLFLRQLFAGFAQGFMAQGDNRIAAQKNARVVGPNFEVDAAMIEDFKAYVASQKPPVRMEDDAFRKDNDFIRAMIRFEVDVALFGAAQARRNLIAKDPQAQHALTLFPEAERLAGLAKAKGIRASSGR